MKDTLWKALDLLRKGGMIKFTRRTAHGKHCALGLLDEAWDYDLLTDSYNKGYNDDVKRLVSVATELFPESRQHSWARAYPLDSAKAPDGYPQRARLANFNNHPDTTQGDLEMVFEKAAIRADEVLS